MANRDYTKHYPTVCGYNAYKFGEALHNWRVSEGLSLDVLERSTGVGQKRLQELQQGKAVTDSEVEQLVKALRFKDVDAFMQNAKTIPKLDKEIVADAFAALLKAPEHENGIRGVSLRTDITQKRIKAFIAREDMSLTLQECYRIACKGFGADSIGDMVMRANSMAPAQDTRMLGRALQYLHKEHIIPDKKTVAQHAGVSANYYRSCLASGHFSGHLVAVLPEATGMASIQDILNRLPEKLEPSQRKLPPTSWTAHVSALSQSENTRNK